MTRWVRSWPTPAGCRMCSTCCRPHGAVRVETTARPGVGAALEDLALVWTDQRDGSSLQVWAGAYDGAGGRQVASFSTRARVLGIFGRGLAIAEGGVLTLLDLKT